MRALYLILSLLIGVQFTTKVSHSVVDEINHQWSNLVVVFSLVGYHEGWQRGKMYSDGFWMQTYADCDAELERSYKRKK